MLLLGGVGIAGFLAWRHFRAPTAPLVLSTPTQPSALSQLINAFGMSLVKKKLDAEMSEMEKRYYLTDRRQYGAPADGVFTCIDRQTGKAVDRAVCNAIINRARGIV